ncbi:MAG: enoyl-CoA hydratase-related protein [Desulfatibacillaceae bacterium]
MEYRNLKVDIQDHVAVLTIAHPPANAFDLVTMQDLTNALDALAHDPEVRVLVLTGDGEKCFSAGFDVADSENQDVTGPMGRDTWTKLDRYEKPVIAAMNGHALGGGLELALCCHFRIAAENPKTRIGLTELNLGIIPGWGGTQRLMRAVGKQKALDMILFSRRLSPAEALEIGLVQQVCPQDKLMDEAMDLAATLARRPPIAVGSVLRAMSAGEYENMDRGLEVEGEGSARVRESEDRTEGFNAFLEKREPEFKGK